MAPRYSDLTGITGERFYILQAGANEGDLAVFDALQGIHPVPPIDALGEVFGLIINYVDTAIATAAAPSREAYRGMFADEAQHNGVDSDVERVIVATQAYGHVIRMNTNSWGFFFYPILPDSFFGWDLHILCRKSSSSCILQVYVAGNDLGTYDLYSATPVDNYDVVVFVDHAIFTDFLTGQNFTLLAIGKNALSSDYNLDLTKIMLIPRSS